MVEFKLTIADPKTGKCVQKTVEGEATKRLIGLKLGETVKGEAIDLTGYEFLITGGSDYCGFPMRKGIQGTRKKILIEKGVGFAGGKKGIKRRKTVCGEAINDMVTQINLKITKQGKANLFEGAEKKEEAPKQ
jgi:small subunit ribosomal protein S6e